MILTLCGTTGTGKTITTLFCLLFVRLRIFHQSNSNNKQNLSQIPSSTLWIDTEEGDTRTVTHFNNNHGKEANQTTT